VGSVPRIEVRLPHRHGFPQLDVPARLLDPAANSLRMAWTGDSVELRFTYTSGTRRRTLLPITWGPVTTPRGHRGRRPWFVCPRCRTWAAILYLPPYGAPACRARLGLRYHSRFEDLERRAMRRARRIRERLDPLAGSWLDPFPAKRL
jgi:hypothetical protein